MQIPSSTVEKAGLHWFSRRFFLLLMNPLTEWQKAADEEITEGALFKGYTLRLCLLCPLLFLPFVLQSSFYMGPIVGIMSCIFVFGINIAITHIYAVIFDSLAVALGGSCGRVPALKLATYALTPWMLLLGLFPIIHEFALLGLVWSLILFSIGSKKLVSLPEGKRFRFISVSAFLCLIALLLSNFFFAGILGMVVGPQMPMPQ